MGGDDDYSSQLEESNRQTMAEIERKKQSLFQTRLDIIKGQGAQSWAPSKPQPNTPAAPKARVVNGWVVNSSGEKVNYTG
jgi:hypothetical protein